MFPPITASHLLPSSSKALLLSNSLALVDFDSGESLTFHHSKSTSLCSLAPRRVSHQQRRRRSIFAPNSSHYLVCFLAVVAIGAIVTTRNPVYTVFELSKQVEDSNPKLAITVTELLEKIKPSNLPSILLDPSDTVKLSNSRTDTSRRSPPAIPYSHPNVVGLMITLIVIERALRGLIVHSKFRSTDAKAGEVPVATQQLVDGRSRSEVCSRTGCTIQKVEAGDIYREGSKVIDRKNLKKRPHET
ncbi:hypothetical protein K1719_006996 [Acacia pycnantha]|nr:hypothetical protein K1719_006996 [Acacia pycnantha]